MPLTYQKRENFHPLGCAPDVKKHGILNFLQENSRLAPIVDFRLGFERYLQINDPDLIQYILVKNHKNYRKSDTHIRFREVLGDGILVSNGNKWRQDRKIIQPVFSKNFVEIKYAHAVLETIKYHQSQWLHIAQQSGSLNVTQEMSFITLKVILKSMLGLDATDAQLKDIDNAIQCFIDYTGLPRLFPKLDLKRCVNAQSYQELQIQKQVLKDFVFNLYENAYSSNVPPNNMLGVLIANNQSFDEICAQIVTMIFAGYETTATLLQWAWYCLDLYPEAEKSVLSELDDLKNKDATFETIDALPYLDAFIKEVMRLYPPFWATARSAIHADQLDEHYIAPNSIVLLPQYTMHRHRDYWESAEIFKPERFMDGQERNIITGSYFPFSLGARKCIGYRFAEMETKLVIARMLPLFKMSNTKSYTQITRPTISLKFEEDIVMSITMR